jgi:hypothetical protein
VVGLPGAKQPDWVALARLKKELLREFREHGVSRVEWVIAFSPPFDFRAWLATSTDADRDALAADPDLDGRVRRLTEKAGLADLFQGTTVESQETVDREYEGSWFYRLR